MFVVSASLLQQDHYMSLFFVKFVPVLLFSVMDCQFSFWPFEIELQAFTPFVCFLAQGDNKCYAVPSIDDQKEFTNLRMHMAAFFTNREISR